MGFTEDELERLAANAEQGRIGESIYCGSCGYNLRHCEIAGPCPECGKPYSARRGAMRGIHRIGDASIPLGDIGWSLGCLAVGALLLSRAFSPVNDWYIFIGGAFAVGGLYMARIAIREMRAYIRFARIQARVRRDSEDF